MIYWDCPYIFFHISTLINSVIDSDWWVYHMSCKVVNHDQAISQYETWQEKPRRKSLLLEFYGIHMGSFKSCNSIYNVHLCLFKILLLGIAVTCHSQEKQSIYDTHHLPLWHGMSHFNDAQYICPRRTFLKLQCSMDPEYFFFFIYYLPSYPFSLWLFQLVTAEQQIQRSFLICILWISALYWGKYN